MDFWRPRGILQPGQLWRHPPGSAAAGAAADKWNSADKSAAITLSNSDLTATGVASNYNDCVRAVTAVASSQKKYWEVNVDLVLGGFSLTTGICNATQPMSGGNPGGDNNAFAMYPSGYFLNNVSPATTLGHFAPGYTTGDNLGFALDLANSLLWTRLNGGNWVGNAAEDPATTAGGFAITALGGAPIYPYCSAAGTQGYTAKFASTDWVYSAPSGFTQI